MAPASEEAEHFRADAGRLRGIARSCASFRVMAGAPAGPGCASGVCGGCAIEPECGSGGVSRKRRVGERMIGKRTPGIMRRAASTSPARLSRCSLRLGILGLVSCFGAGRFLESVKAPGRTAPGSGSRNAENRSPRRAPREARALSQAFARSVGVGRVPESRESVSDDDVRRMQRWRILWPSLGRRDEYFRRYGERLFEFDRRGTGYLHGRFERLCSGIAGAENGDGRHVASGDSGGLFAGIAGWPLGMSVIVNAKVSGKWISIIGMVIDNSCLFRPITAGVTIGA